MPNTATGHIREVFLTVFPLLLIIVLVLVVVVVVVGGGVVLTNVVVFRTVTFSIRDITPKVS